MSDWPPPKARDLVKRYLDHLKDAGVADPDLEIAKDFLSGEPSEKSEEELLLDIKAAWPFVREVHVRKGHKL